MQTVPADTREKETLTPADAGPPQTLTEYDYGDPATQRTNFYSWVSYQFFYRIGWQFKMESTMMAGLISYLTPSPAVMGLFTTMNNAGRNLAPLLAAPVVDHFRHRRSALLLFWGMTAAVWAALTLYLWLPAAGDRDLSIWIFGACYTLFFLSLGASSVAQGALLGKIIPAEMRGGAMAMGMGLSGAINVGAIFLIYNVLRGGRFPEPRNYALAFTLTVSFFLLAGVSLLFIKEQPSEPVRRGFNPLASVRHFVKLARENPNLARLMVVNVAVGTGGSMLQFYTGYWRQAGTMTASALMLATLLQVFWQSLSSSILGRVADRQGNRALICRLLWIEAAIPVAALILGGWEPFRGHWGWYLGVYTLVGVRFPLFQLLVNYLLEVVPQREHAMALGAVTTVQLATAGAPLILGIVASAWGYPVTFLLGCAAVIYGAVTAQGLEEVRVKQDA
jgi:MFS family permease